MTEHLALVELARITDVGRVRGHNEDRHLVRQPLVAVADGMGGAQAGEVAALAAAEVGCCSFFTFSLHLDQHGLALDIAAPPDARALVDGLLGASR